jgi:hypothetical protein
MSRDREPLKSEVRNADRKVIETTQELIALFKREFGDQWQSIFSSVVSIEMRPETS